MNPATNTNCTPTPTPDTARLYLGLGCDRNTPAAAIVQAITDALTAAGCTLQQVVAAASISIKQNEAGLLEALAQLEKPLRFYPPELLATVPVPNPSAVVLKYTGTPSVSEACALLLANGNTTPAHFDNLLLEKHKHKGSPAEGSCNATVSIAVRQ